MVDQILENAIVYLIRQDRFYAELLHRMKKKFTTEIETMGVTIDIQGVHLFINPYFLKDLSVPFQAEVLKHECEHLFRDHIGRAKTIAPSAYKDNQSILDQFKSKSIHYMLNLAGDFAINETLKLPEKFRVFDKQGNSLKDPDTGEDMWASPACVSDLMKMFPDDDIQRNQAMEYYYSFIKQKKEEGAFKGRNKDGFIIVPMDDHNQLAEALEEIDEQFASAILSKLAKEAKAATPGRIPGHMEIAIDSLNKKTKDWRSDVQMFTAMATNSEEECTNKRRNRRYGLQYPGKRSLTKATIVVAIDDSGSVTDKYLTQFMSEVPAIKEAGVNVIVVMCDSAVSQVYEYEDGIPLTSKGRGGTSFKPVFDLIDTEDFTQKYGEIDGLIYLTDGDDFGSLKQTKVSIPVLWALLPECNVEYDWGQKTWITVE